MRLWKTEPENQHIPESWKKDQRQQRGGNNQINNGLWRSFFIVK